MARASPWPSRRSLRMDRIDRRHFIACAGAATALKALPSAAIAAAAPRRADAAAEQLLAEVAEALLADYPESASALGIDKGPRAGLKARLFDRSPGGRARLAASAAARLAKLKAAERS